MKSVPVNEYSVMNCLNRRRFLQNAAIASLAGASLSTTEARAGQLPKRRFTMNLFPELIGVKADSLEAIKLARQYGYESVVPRAWLLAKCSESQLQEVVTEMKSNGLTWGAANLSPFFDPDEDKYKEKRQQIVENVKVLQRAGVTRRVTWTGFGSNSLTYVANFRHDATPGNIKMLVAAIMNADPSEVTAESSKIAFSDQNPCHGRLVRLEATETKTRANKDFTLHKFLPIPNDVQQKAAELRANAGFTPF